ncbi:hypothetical protein EJ04DRAFT_468282 [Polyplosphaeria fusca]|uniref:chitinase n=1 Tax=Polyplosphaeria fusca TaxID=682080 RepID=A0A9P4UYS6_9PLEO|nr:hypothetical protein EJ04DRAFT_468282 [Polyplosphaeria fusca]
MAGHLSITLISILLYLSHALVHAHSHGVHHSHPPHSLSNVTEHSFSLFGREQGDARCDASNECADKSCCNGVTGWCGRDPDHCAAGICLSNCDAKADCGVGAEVPGQTCPLNVCCGKSGYCGTTNNFCAEDLGCQSHCPQPGSTGAKNGDVRDLVIGYWEGWSLTSRGCDKRSIDDVPVDSLTHLNLAFAYIEPKTFEIVPMQGVSEHTISQITNLKQRAPGLKIWISIGGWTFSDNDTDTQAVWGDLASSQNKRTTFANNVYKFMKHWGFDGVDLDWEYPGAPDRGGHKEDTQNYVNLLETIHVIFEASASDFGLSFTAPTSYWYLRWFAIGQMYKYVNWINLMTYDLHGSWDSPQDQIGSFVYAHTNKTEIHDALNLFWRNDVPANKINLGIGFYGRSYTLKDANCNKAGCPFSRSGTAGECTGQGGILSYTEIEEYISSYDLNTVYDEDAEVKYMAWGDNQWVSYDDKETLKKKVDFANDQGLGGLFVWAIDYDDKKHSALAALLGGKLGKFAKQNGVDPNWNRTEGWEGVTGNQCSWTKCGTEECGPGMLSTDGQQYCGVKNGKAQKQTLCCPIKAAPAKCDWSGSLSDFVCSSVCPDGKIAVASSQEPYVNGEHKSCWSGFAQYCCESEGDIEDICGWTNKCVDAKDTSVCGDRNFVTTRRADCKYPKGYAYCCDKGVDTSSCYWNEGKTDFTHFACTGSSSCGKDEIRIATDEHGGKDKNGNHHECEYELPTDDPFGDSHYADIAFCCNAKAMGKETIKLPVPLENLFPKPGPASDTERLDIKLDRTMGGQRNAGNDVDPNKNAFGFYILSGPDNEITTFNKRDDSHWEIFDCDNSLGEERQTVKAVCTDVTEDSNCDIVFRDGVALTIIEMPDDCGPGKYSVAVSLTESSNHTHLYHRLAKRGLQDHPIYDFTFDYDFSPLERRDQSNVLVRIDYSDDPGYWSHIVSAPHDKAKRDLEVEVKFGGDHKAWLEHTWHREKRSLDKDELHKRWWSGNVKEWWDRQREIDVDYTGIRHQVRDTFTVKIFDQDLKCPQFPEWVDDLYFRSWAKLTVDIQTAAGVTVIGNLGNLKSFDESSAWFHTSGSIDASLNFEAMGKMSFHTGQVELFGAHNFGASFRVPGIVTIGPDFRVLGSLSGDASLHMTSSYTVNFAKWDYSMRYPVPKDETDKPAKMGDYKTPTVDHTGDPFKWDLDANGQLTAHITPKVTLGIVFDSSAISNAALDLGVDSYTRLYADLKVGHNQPLVYCYGMDGGATLFANIEAPKLFNTELSRYYPIWPYTYDILPKKCSDGST